MLKDPKILILNEATSALDSISENAIQDALGTLMEGRASIVIAHRPSTILKADRILVISGGVITESGDHKTLLAQNGICRELYETQFNKVLEYEAEVHPPQAGSGARIDHCGSLLPWQYQNSAPMPAPPMMFPAVTGSRFLSRKFPQVRAERSTPDSAASNP